MPRHNTYTITHLQVRVQSMCIVTCGVCYIAISRCMFGNRALDTFKLEDAVREPTHTLGCAAGARGARIVEVGANVCYP